MKNSTQQPEENVVIAARVPPSIKENVEKLAEAAHRTASQHIHYLIVTHPEYVEAFKAMPIAVSQ